MKIRHLYISIFLSVFVVMLAFAPIFSSKVSARADATSGSGSSSSTLGTGSGASGSSGSGSGGTGGGGSGGGASAGGGNSGEYHLLEGVQTSQAQGPLVEGAPGITLKVYIVNGVKVVIGFMALLAVLLLVIAGVQYAAVGVSEAGKTAAKAQIEAVFMGLAIALGSWLLLNLINPDLVNLKFDPSTLQVDASGLGGGGGGGGGGGRTVGDASREAADRGAGGSGPASERVLAAAQGAVGTFETCSIAGTNSGRLGCAAAVSVIIAEGIGDTSIATLGTSVMQTRLAASSNFDLVSGGLASAQPGDVVITPTRGNVSGHVGIYEGGPNRTIISNSSRRARVERNYNTGSWEARFNRRNLITYVYRPKG